MAHTLFIADLHLKPTRQDLNQGFIDLCRSEIARSADALYILGDFVEFWIGDDTPTTGIKPSLRALKTLADTGVKVYFQHGNRDFLIGDAFARRYGVELLDEEVVIDLYGTPTLLLHGDTLCSDDVDYQNFRAMVRDPAWQQDLLGKSPYQRIRYAQQLRAQTSQAVQAKSAEIMDVNQDSVINTFTRYQVQHMIHGHTHRPAEHRFAHGGKTYCRVVLSDWEQYAHYYCVRDNGDSEAKTLPIQPRLTTRLRRWLVKPALALTLLRLMLRG